MSGSMFICLFAALMCLCATATAASPSPHHEDNYNYTAHGKDYEVKYKLQHSGVKVVNIDELAKEGVLDDGRQGAIFTGLENLTTSDSTLVFEFNTLVNASIFLARCAERFEKGNIITGHPSWGLQSHVETHGFLFFLEGPFSQLEANISVPVSVAELHHVFHHGEVTAAFPFHLEDATVYSEPKPAAPSKPTTSPFSSKAPAPKQTPAPAKLLNLWDSAKSAFKKTQKAIVQVAKKVVTTIRTAAERVVDTIKRKVNEMVAFLSNKEFATKLEDGALELGSFNRESGADTAKCQFGMDTVGVTVPSNIELTCTDCWAHFQGGAYLRLKFKAGMFDGVSFTVKGSATVKLQQELKVTGAVEWEKDKMLFQYVGKAVCVTIFLVPICVLPSAVLEFFVTANANQAVPALSAGVKVHAPFEFTVGYFGSAFQFEKSFGVDVSEKNINLSPPASVTDLLDGALSSTDIGVKMKLLASFNGIGGPTFEMVPHINTVASFDSTDQSCAHPKLGFKSNLQVDGVVFCELAVRIGGAATQVMDAVFEPVEVLSESESLKSFCFNFGGTSATTMIGTTKTYSSATTTTTTRTPATKTSPAVVTKSSSTTTSSASGSAKTTATEDSGGGTFSTSTAAEAILNPFLWQNPGYRASPSCVDIDADGDQDCFVGTSSGHIVLYKNVGSATVPSFTKIGYGEAGNPFTKALMAEPSAPFALLSPSASSLAFADVNGDGKIDAIQGQAGGLVFWLNSGTAQEAAFTRYDDTAATNANNPVYKLGVDNVKIPADSPPIRPALCDIDGDGLVDMLIGVGKELVKYTNTGTANNPAFTQSTFNAAFGAPPLKIEDSAVKTIYGQGSIDNGGQGPYITPTCSGKYAAAGTGTGIMYSKDLSTAYAYGYDEFDGWKSGGKGNDLAPHFVDLDGDGDVDLLIGYGMGSIEYHKNTGTMTAPVFVNQNIKPEFQMTPVNFSPDLVRMGSTVNGRPKSEVLSFQAAKMMTTADDVSYAASVNPFVSTAGLGRIFSVSFFINAETNTDSAVLLMYEWDCGTSKKCSFGIKNPNSLEVWMTNYAGQQTSFQFGGSTIADMKWHHIAFVFRDDQSASSKAMLYVDGAVVSTISTHALLDESGTACSASARQTGTTGATDCAESVGSPGILFFGQLASSTNPASRNANFTGLKSTTEGSHQYTPAASFKGEIATLKFFPTVLTASELTYLLGKDLNDPSLAMYSFFKGIFQNECSDCFKFYSMDPYDTQVLYHNIDFRTFYTPRRGMECGKLQLTSISGRQSIDYTVATCVTTFGRDENGQVLYPAVYIQTCTEEDSAIAFKAAHSDWFESNDCQTNRVTGFVRGIGFQEMKGEGYSKWPNMAEGADWTRSSVELGVTQTGSYDWVKPYTCTQKAVYDGWNADQLLWDPPCLPGASTWCTQSCANIMITRRKANSFGDYNDPLNYDPEVSCASSKKEWSTQMNGMVGAVPDKLMLATKIIGRYCLTHDGVCAENGKCLPATQHVDLYPERMCKKMMCPFCKQHPYCAWVPKFCNFYMPAECDNGCDSDRGWFCAEWMGDVPFVATAPNPGSADGAEAGLLDASLLNEKPTCDPTEEVGLDAASIAEAAKAAPGVIDVTKASDANEKANPTPKTAPPAPPGSTQADCCNSSCCWCTAASTAEEDKKAAAKLSDVEYAPYNDTTCASSRVQSAPAFNIALLAASVLVGIVLMSDAHHDGPTPTALV